MYACKVVTREVEIGGDPQQQKALPQLTNPDHMFPWLVQPAAAPAPAKPGAPPIFAAPALAAVPPPPHHHHQAPPLRPPLRRRPEQPAPPQPQGLDDEGREAVRRLCAVLRRKKPDAPELEAMVAQYTGGLPAVAAAVREVLARPLNPAQRLEALQALAVEAPVAPAAPAATCRGARALVLATLTEARARTALGLGEEATSSVARRPAQPPPQQVRCCAMCAAAAASPAAQR